MTRYTITRFANGGWVITDKLQKWDRPQKATTFAFDTETLVYVDGRVMSQDAIYQELRDVPMAELRERVTTDVWAWQCYDERNGFMMTNDFYKWLFYQARAGYKYGWCYNAKFDFANIDYKILGEHLHPWQPHVHRDGHAYNKGQPWAYESIHNDMGARYAYKLWIPYKSADRHTYVHPVEYRDMMNVFAGGLARMLEALDVRDEAGNPIRKLAMEYQAVDTDNLTDDEIDYCKVDVQGLYYAIKQYDVNLAEQSGGERHIFGDDTNVMTAGGYAKAALLRSMYPNIKPKQRVKAYQKDHPMSAERDEFFRNNHLYRGGICFVNPKYQGKLQTADMHNSPMYRYDVNSEYPFAMSVMRDLVGYPKRITYREWLNMPREERERYECIMELTSVFGSVRDGYMPLWYDPIRKDYTEYVNEDYLHLIFEREFEELCKWYDLEYNCETVILMERGGYAYKPFVEQFYALKAQAKRDKNRGVELVAKLVLNSSYGKLAERVERVKGHYELNVDTGAVHFVTDGREIDETGVMSVICGALVTSIARCWVMSHIREICGEDEMIDKYFYCDTDSVHTAAFYDNADAYNLGGFKLEAVCEAWKYLAPKTYFDVDTVGADGVLDVKDVEMHSKGINIKSVKTALGDDLTLALLDKSFDYGAKYICLCAMNVKGGKALVPISKYLATLDLSPTGEPMAITWGYDKNIYSEV